MARKQIAIGVVHNLPMDFQKVLSSDTKELAVWESITPLARNEWICWIESAKKEANGVRP
ncbi:YdeI/OmpD-associated family protein [Legionella sp. PATHC038]|uniref:YdeI/OmpD-associated family protein n=1 Tax=Legionella sheltonii TaxID=2992041 RepID=UPI002243E968|nr:YdeI/OmpD-associated family protein [Legionella sp. PATHC038]MCW8399165.1 YdeI/OmpD-associated family protein [Legionella sp. PATHC038]